MTIFATGALASLAGCLSMGGGGGGGREPLDRTRMPQVGPPPSMDLPETRRFTLSGGLPVVLMERHDLPVVDLELLVRGGSAALGTGEAGLAALTADMLDEGAGGRSALELSAAVERLGATLSSGAGFDASQVEMTVLRPRLEAALDLLADVVRRPAFPQAELERVKNERMARILQDLDDPRALATNAFAAVLYGEDHPWGWPLPGSRETLSRFTRQDVVGFWRERYHPGLATLVVTGDVTEPDLEALLEPRFGDWKSRPAPPVALPEPPAVQGPVIFLVDRPGAAQSEIRVGRVAVPRGTADYFPLTVLNTVLGGSFTSRLNRKLREEKGYTYGAGSGFSMRVEPGPFVASAAVHTPVTDSAVVVMLAEIRRLREEAVPAPELERAERYLALGLPQRFETVDDLAARLAETVLYDLPPGYWDAYVERILAVTADDVRRVARAWLDPARMVVVVAGDRAEVEAPLRALGFPVEVLPGPPRP